MHEPLSKFKDGEELAWEVGSQLCGMIAEHEKNQLNQGILNASKYRIEYFKAKKERRMDINKENKESIEELLMPNGLTKRENEIMNKYILNKKREGEEEEEEEESEDEEERKDEGGEKKGRKYIDELQLLIYGSVASDEQILGRGERLSKRKEKEQRKRQEAEARRKAEE